MLAIKIVSDVSCPWCVIGYRSLLSAVKSLALEEQIKIEWKPFELNPKMPPEGQDRAEHIQQKYGLTPTQSAGNRDSLINRGKEVGYDFNFSANGRIYNTFDAHRLLHWAAEHGKQTELKLAMFDLYFRLEGNPSSHEDLLRCVTQAGLDESSAKDILQSDAYSEQVRRDEEWNFQNGITAVPAFIFNDEVLVSGGQPKETFIKVLNQMVETSNH